MDPRPSTRLAHVSWPGQADDRPEKAVMEPIIPSKQSDMRRNTKSDGECKENIYLAGHASKPDKNKSLSSDVTENYDMLENDFVEELRGGWDDLGDSTAQSVDDERAKRASSQALLAKEGFMATTYSLAKEFFMRLVGGGTGPSMARYGSTSYSRRG